MDERKTIEELSTGLIIDLVHNRSNHICNFVFSQ